MDEGGVLFRKLTRCQTFDNQYLHKVTACKVWNGKEKPLWISQLSIRASFVQLVY